MKTRRNMVKRWIAGVLAVTMLSSTMSTAAFAAPESTDAPETVETTRVTAWNWTDGSALTWQEDTSAWTLTLSEEQTISAEADLLALLPVSVEATLAQAETESTPAPDTAATPAPESTPDTEATEVTPTPVAEVDPAAEEGATAPAAAALVQPEEGATGADTLSVEPQNIEEATPAPETATPAPTAAPQPAESPAPTEDAEPTEEPAATETLTLTWDTAALTYPLAGGDYTVTAALPEGYALDEAALALAVVVKVPGAEEEDTPAADNSLSDGASAPSMMAGEGTVQTVNPVGTTINLFDYWFSSPTEKTDDFQNVYKLRYDLIGIEHADEIPYYQTDWCKGINQNHVLKFTPSTGKWAYKILTEIDPRNIPNPTDKANRYVNEGNGPYTGIVANTLVDGYPQLSDTERVDGSVSAEAAGEVEKLDYSESLDYLFDPSLKVDGRAAYSNVKGLFYLDDNGYYAYDCSEHFAQFTSDGNGSGNFTLTGPQGFGFDGDGGQFFPFNSPTTDNKATANHFFGLTMTTHFMQTDDGKDANNNDVIYHFAGDDDVWVFIDGVLVGDLGGIHQKASLDINFSTGDITIANAVQNTEQTTIKSNLKQKFIDALGENNINEAEFSGTTFASGTYHTLQFFYLERGANQSNLELKFNLVSAPESTIASVDQNGNGVNATSFTLYGADKNYAQQDMIATGATKVDGKLVLEDNDGKTIGLQDLWASLSANGVFTDDETGLQRVNLILNQSLPDGYRGASTIYLYLLQSGNNVLLLSDNTWETGAYAYSNSTITLSDTNLTSWSGQNKVDLANATGTLFAVVLRRDPKDVGIAQPENSNWYMMTGDATNGWQMSGDIVNNNVGAVLNLYGEKTKNNYYIVERNSSGGYDTTVSDLPGDVTKYYYMVDNKVDAEYNVAFYYTSASSIEDATEANTWMVGNTGSWRRVFSTNVYVANIKNYLLVQQLDPNGKPIVGAKFKLYADNYFNTDGTVNPDATLIGSEATTRNFDKKNDNIDLEGAAYFPNGSSVLKPGTYYLVQSYAPDGYEINSNVTKIIVDNTGVYADAGKKDDGIQVSRGVGSVVKSMAEFASSPDIDATLNNIVAKFYTSESYPISSWRHWDEQAQDFVAENNITYIPSYYYDSTTGKYSLAQISEATPLGMHMEYGTNEAILEYGPGKDISLNMAEGESAIYWMVTDTGWSNLMIEQCQQHTQATGKNYEPLAGKDLSNLFSRSVVVQVTDQVQTCELTISKTVDNPVGNDNQREFAVGVTLKDASGVALSGPYTFTVVDSETGASYDGTPLPLKDGAGTVTLTAGQSVVIEELPYGTMFTVTENEPNYSATYTVTGPDGQVIGGGTTEGGDTSAGDTTGDDSTTGDTEENPATPAEATGTLEGNHAVAITNTRKAGSVAVSNTVEGAMGSYSDTFSYTLNLYDVTVTEDQPGKANISGTYTATITKEGNPSSTETVTITFDGNGQATQMMLAGESTAKAITLAHGDTLTIAGLPAGASFEAVETDNHKGYIVAVDPQKPGEGGTKVERTGLVTVPNLADVTPTPTIAFTNTREAIVPTGMREENNPYIVMIGLAGMAALVGAAGWVEMRRRKRREEE